MNMDKYVKSAVKLGAVGAKKISHVLEAIIIFVQVVEGAFVMSCDSLAALNGLNGGRGASLVAVTVLGHSTDVRV